MAVRLLPVKTVHEAQEFLQEFVSLQAGKLGTFVYGSRKTGLCCSETSDLDLTILAVRT